MKTNEKHGQLLAKLGIASLNPMQIATGKAMVSNKNLLLLGPTGSGKTLAYLLPVLDYLNPDLEGTQCAIIVPSRELAMQIDNVWRSLGTGYKVSCVYGGRPLNTELHELTEPPTIIVGTPGRMGDHIRRGSLNLANVRILVLDEFDKSLEFGFHDEMEFIVNKMKSIERRMLVSATSGVQIPEFMRATRLHTLDFIEEKRTSGNLTLKKVVAGKNDKLATLFNTLCAIGPQPTIIFCLHREETENLSRTLEEMRIENAFFHGGMEQIDRERTLMKFRNGTTTYLVATDLAARGLDIPTVKHIIHYQFPPQEDEFIQRNGRTARMDSDGTAYLIWEEGTHWPNYVPRSIEAFQLPAKPILPKPSDWATVYVSGGKKDKLSKTDILGFFVQKGGLDKDDVGMIVVKDYYTFVAVRKFKVRELVIATQNEKMKGQKYKLEVAR